MSYAIFVGLSLVACSFHALALYSSRHIVILPGLVIYLTVVLFLSIVFFLLVPVLLRRQVAVSRSSVEAELRAMTLVTADVTWLWWLLEDFGVFVSMPTPLLSDSTWAISITRDSVKHELTKNIGVDAHFTRS
jgi:hypothetical protein